MQRGPKQDRKLLKTFRLTHPPEIDVHARSRKIFGQTMPLIGSRLGADVFSSLKREALQKKGAVFDGLRYVLSDWPNRLHDEELCHCATQRGQETMCLGKNMKVSEVWIVSGVETPEDLDWFNGTS